MSFFLIKIQSGINFTNILHKAFTSTDNKSTKKTDSLTEFIAVLGSAHIKAAHKMLVKSAPGVNFINSLHTNFAPIFWCQK
jgi:hypothetical protein